MDPALRRAMRNAARLAARLKSGEETTPKEAIDILRAPDFPEDEATVRHSYRHYVIRGGIENANAVITYTEAAHLADTTVDALRSAAYRGKLIMLGTLNVEGDGRRRRGITLRSLAEFKRWPLARFEEAARQVAKWRKAER